MHAAVSAGQAGMDAARLPGVRSAAPHGNLRHCWKVARRWYLALWAWHRPQPFAGIVSLQGSGAWLLSGEGPYWLAQAWQGAAWITLRLVSRESPAAQRPLDITIWKCCMAQADWRGLRVQVARQLAMPRRTLKKESA